MFWALTKATLLVSGSRRMKPHSLCMGLCVSGWKALNLDQELTGGALGTQCPAEHVQTRWTSLLTQ